METKNYHRLDDVNESNYQVPKGEENYFHVVVETPTFDPTTGERLSKPCIVKWNRMEGKKMLEVCIHQMRMSVRVLHDPFKNAAVKAKEEVPAADDSKDNEIAELKKMLAEKNREIEGMMSAIEQHKAKAEAAPEVKAESAKSEEEKMAEAAVKTAVKKPQSKTTKKK